MYNNISEILIKAARSASQATVLELIKQTNNRKPGMIKEAVGAGRTARVLFRKLIPGLITSGVVGGGGWGIKEYTDHRERVGRRAGLREAEEELKRRTERDNAIANAREEGNRQGREQMASEQETQRRAAAEREAIAEAARQAGIANSSEMTIDQLADFYAKNPNVPVPDSLKNLINSRNQSDLSSMLSNNKFMLGGGLAGAGIGYGLAGEDTKSKVLGALLGGSLGGGLGALVDHYVK